VEHGWRSILCNAMAQGLFPALFRTKGNPMKLNTLLLGGLLMMTQASAQGASASGAPVFSTDALGRPLPTPTEVGPLRTDRFVGIFYFMFINYDSAVYDVSKILAEHPDAEINPASPPWGPFGNAHFWGEPLFGYYKIIDPWVLRRHAQLLSDAGVDFVVFDTTNALHYPEIMPIIFDTWTELRAAGDATPQCIFMVNTKAGETGQNIFESFYGNEIRPRRLMR
jgi:hypothetical protein